MVDLGGGTAEEKRERGREKEGEKENYINRDASHIKKINFLYSVIQCMLICNLMETPIQYP